MIHIVTAANRCLYQRQIEEMHRLRWKYYVEERGWEELRKMQTRPDTESDLYDDERAVYVVGIDAQGAITGSIRLRPTDDRSLLADRFLALLDDPASFKPGADVWEITRVVRKPENRTKDYALRFSMNAAMFELMLSRGVRKMVTTLDTFLVPSTRSLMRHKVRPLGLPTPYAEGEMIALEYTIDAEALQMVREAAGFVVPHMFEMPAPVPDRPADPVLSERVARLIAPLAPADLAQVADWLEARGAAVKQREEAGHEFGVIGSPRPTRSAPKQCIR